MADFSRPFSIVALLITALVIGACAPRGTYTPLPPRGSITSPSAGWAEVTGGQALIKVKKGDTLYGIAREYGVSLKELIAANNLAEPYMIRVGQTLILRQAATYSVVKGDTLYSIAQTYGVAVSALARENGISAPYTLKIGQKLSLPDGATVAVASAPPKSSGTSGKKASSQPTRSTSRKTAPLPKVSAVPTGRFSWPVTGEVISGFGLVGKGLHNDGINIAVDTGTAVKASRDGTVAYAGNELRGFGNLLLVRHAGGWVTAYAHNSEMLVKKGDKVKRGQQIARSGQTGNVTRPQVHFEIRKGSTPVDPTRYLPRPQS